MNWVESLLGGALVAIALAPLIYTALGAGHRRSKVAPASLAVLGGFAAAFFGLVDSPQAVLPPPTVARADGYISSNTCRSCHPREYATWHQSYHRTMTQRASASTAVGKFNDMELELDGVSYYLSQRGDTLWARWEGGRRQLVLMTGSHHDQMYWYPSDAGTGEDLEQFPFSYSRRLDRWVPTRSSFLFPPGANQNNVPGMWSSICARCHAVHPPRHPDAPRRVAELGIACEACHGPAEEHVAAHRNPLRRIASRLDEASDPTIVQPEHLDSHRAAAAVCGQCHGVAVSEAGTYRPGDDIQRTRMFLQLRYLDPSFRPQNSSEVELQRAHRAFVREQPRVIRGTFWSDGVVRVSGREFSGLLESPCFERGEMTCSSCHTLHQASDDPRKAEEWANDQLSVGMESNVACLQCHPRMQGPALEAHTHHKADSTGSLCYNCHMSYSVYGIQKAHRSHTIASPSVAESIEVGRPNACNQCHLDRTLRWSARNLSNWYGIDSPELELEESTIAAGALWALRGDAGMRALMAWSMGWAAAREASGAEEEGDWMVPYLAELLDDPYDSVRFIALLSLRDRPEFAHMEYDFVGPAEERSAVARSIGGRATYTHAATESDASRAVLLDAFGTLDRIAFARLLGARDDTPLLLRE